MSSETPLPVTMESFWASSMNKANLQLLLWKHILDNLMAAADIVVNAIRLTEIEPARGVFSNIATTLPELNVKIEEADVRMSLHALHSVNGGASGVILQGNRQKPQRTKAPGTKSPKTKAPQTKPPML